VIVTLQDKSAMAGFYLFYIPCELYSYNALIISVFVLTLGEECIIEGKSTRGLLRCGMRGLLYSGFSN
jgi:hypothetical protein